jgi:hypothetical protein
VEAEACARLRAARRAANVRLRERSRRVGISASMRSQIENGRAQPSVATRAPRVRDSRSRTGVIDHFDSAIPHSYVNREAETARGLWHVVGRSPAVTVTPPATRLSTRPDVAADNNRRQASTG